MEKTPVPEQLKKSKPKEKVKHDLDDFLIDGEPVVLGKPGHRQTYYVPPLTLKNFKKTGKIIKQLSDPELPLEKQIELMEELILLALQRNYPSLTKETLQDDMVDLKNVKDIFEIITKETRELLGKASPNAE